MANPPWKSNVGPSDEQLDRAVQDHKRQEQQEAERRRQQVLLQVGSEEIYDGRLFKQGWRSEAQQWWNWDRKTKTRRPIANKRHAASAAVNEGTIKALTTKSLPLVSSPAWLFRVDTNAGIDEHRKEQHQEDIREALLCEASSGCFRSNPNHDGSGIQFDSDVLGTTEIDHEDGVAEEMEAKENAIRLQKLARLAGVEPLDLEWVIQNKALGLTTRKIAQREGLSSHTTVVRATGRALRKMSLQPGGKDFLKKMKWL